MLYGGRFLSEDVVGGTPLVRTLWAVDRDEEADVCLLVLELDPAKHDDARAALTHAARCMSRVGSLAPRVVETGVDELGRPWLGFLPPEGRDAFTTLEQLGRRRRPLPRADALAITRAVARHLSLLHELGWVLGTFTPRDVWLDESLATVTFTGFEHARRLAEEVPTPLTRWLTPRFTAPEVLSGEVADARADVFSLGTLLRLLLRGDLSQRAWDDDASGLDEIDRGLRFVLSLALWPEREGRMQTPSELADSLTDDALRAVSDREPLGWEEATRAPPVESPAPPEGVVRAWASRPRAVDAPAVEERPRVVLGGARCPLAVLDDAGTKLWLTSEPPPGARRPWLPTYDPRYPSQGRWGAVPAGQRARSLVAFGDAMLLLTEDGALFHVEATGVTPLPVEVGEVVDVIGSDHPREPPFGAVLNREGRVFGVRLERDADEMSLRTTPMLAGARAGFRGLGRGSFWNRPVAIDENGGVHHWNESPVDRGWRHLFDTEEVPTSFAYGRDALYALFEDGALSSTNIVVDTHVSRASAFRREPPNTAYDTPFPRRWVQLVVTASARAMFLDENGCAWASGATDEGAIGFGTQDVPGTFELIGVDRPRMMLGSDLWPIEGVAALDGYNEDSALLLHDDRLLLYTTRRAPEHAPPAPPSPPPLPSLPTGRRVTYVTTYSRRAKYGGPDGDWDDREHAHRFEVVAGDVVGAGDIAAVFASGSGTVTGQRTVAVDDGTSGISADSERGMRLRESAWARRHARLRAAGDAAFEADAPQLTPGEVASRRLFVSERLDSFVPLEGFDTAAPTALRYQSWPQTRAEELRHHPHLRWGSFSSADAAQRGEPRWSFHEAFDQVIDDVGHDRVLLFDREQERAHTFTRERVFLAWLCGLLEVIPGKRRAQIEEQPPTLASWSAAIARYSERLATVQRYAMLSLLRWREVGNDLPVGRQWRALLGDFTHADDENLPVLEVTALAREDFQTAGRVRQARFLQRRRPGLRHRV
jgi:hypothetical protein